MAHAEVGAKKAEMAKLSSIDDFNKKEEARLAKLKADREAAKAAKPKVPKLNKAGRYICANKGCKAKTFTDDEQSETACHHHTGEAVFHDLKKYWSCCNPNGDSGKDRMAYDWDEFLLLPTCSVGPHKIKYA